jgi:hypothetical protein
MTEDSLITVRRSNQEIMQQELFILRQEQDELFEKWLNAPGEYVTDTKVRFAKFKEKALEYKTLRFKVIENKRGL